MSQPRPGIIIITGAGSGIGNAAARALAPLGYTLILVGRRQHALEATAAQIPGTPTIIYPADITIDTDRQTLLSLLPPTSPLPPPPSSLVAHRSSLPSLPLLGLINAAGIVHRAPIEHTPPKSIDALFATNALAPAHLISLLWPHLRDAARQGHHPRIINIASLAVHAPLDGLFAYAASKFALAGLTVASAQQASRDGIITLCLCPGSTDTPMLHSVTSHTEIPPDQIMPAAAIGTLIANAMQGALDNQHGKALPIIPRNQQTWWHTQRVNTLSASAWLALDDALFL